ncbi:MAG: nitrilase-related carbon-nitrogen hydrolase [Verrucomicrobiota bacterium]
MEAIDRVRIACAQLEVSEGECLEAFQERLGKTCRAASAQAADFLLLPEYFSLHLLSTRATLSPSEGIQTAARENTDQINACLARLAETYQLCIIGGSQPICTDLGLMNVCQVFMPTGLRASQAKLHITPSEVTEWSIQGGDTLALIKTSKLSFGVQICYDIEFPEATKLLTQAGADLIFVPYCTEDIYGHHRVTICARARAIENQVYIATAGLVGELPRVPNMEAQYARSGVYSPIDIGLPEDGIVAQVAYSEDQLLITELQLSLLRKIREEGCVRPLDAQRNHLFALQKQSIKLRHYE